MSATLPKPSRPAGVRRAGRTRSDAYYRRLLAAVVRESYPTVDQMLREQYGRRPRARAETDGLQLYTVPRNEGA